MLTFHWTPSHQTDQWPPNAKYTWCVFHPYFVWLLCRIKQFSTSSVFKLSYICFHKLLSPGFPAAILEAHSQFSYQSAFPPCCLLKRICSAKFHLWVFAYLILSPWEILSHDLDDHSYTGHSNINIFRANHSLEFQKTNLTASFYFFSSQIYFFI